MDCITIAWEEGGITYNDDNPNDITGLIDEVFVDNHLTLSPPTAPVEKGLELVFPEFDILTGIRAIFNGALKATFSVTARNQRALFKDIPYSNKVKTQMSQGAGEMHSFPESVRAFEQNGTISYIRGNDGQLYKQLIIKGSYPNSKGVWKDGQFEFMLDKNGFINHRFFRKNH